MLRIIPLGGMGTVTKNMYVYEQGQDILVVDCGIGFPDPTMLGVDLLIPDTTYLEARRDRIVGMLLTHAHDDHIAGLPYILPKLGNIPIFASKLTKGFAEDRLRESFVSPNITEIDNDPFPVGPFTIDPIRVTHSVPDARHFAITTAEGVIYHGSDYKFDPQPLDGIVSDLDKITRLGEQGITCLLSDSLRSEKAGHSRSESLLAETFAREMQDTTGKFIITIMSSNVHRIQQAIDVAVKHNRRLAFIGRSVEENVKTATRLGFLQLPTTAVINKRQIKKCKPQELAIIIAGSQGQEGSSLVRASQGEHKFVTITPEDKVVFSADPIPGNENAVYGMIDELSRLGTDVVYTDISDDLHVSGHAYQDEINQLIALTKPQYLIPIGGTFRHMVQYRKLARKLGYRDQQVLLLENGEVVTLSAGQAEVTETIPLRNVMVDGLGIGDVGTVVLRDRQTMAADGIVVVVVPVEQQTGTVRGKVEIISRGFVFMRQSQGLVQEIETEVHHTLKRHGFVSDWTSIRKKIESHLEIFLYQKTQRRPLVLTVVMEV